ncbi:MAG: site-2 protease family protein [Chromatiales bacterium]|jgi:Zn-dependent protease
MQQLTLIQVLAAGALPLIFAVTLHEAAHGWIAKQLGDSTAAMLGRVTLNPIRHIDPVGTILVPVAMLVVTMNLAQPLVFGWAKPVPVSWDNLNNPRRDMALVAAAGPGANLVMALLWGLAAKTGVLLGGSLEWAAGPLIAMGLIGVTFNAVLMVLNLLPILPLDGGRILTALMPPKLAWRYGRLEPWGLFIVLGLLFTGILATILFPLITAVRALVFGLFGL